MTYSLENRPKLLAGTWKLYPVTDQSHQTVCATITPLRPVHQQSYLNCFL